MNKILVALILAGASLHAQDARMPSLDGIDPWFGTFSIIAFDPATNELGVGVPSGETRWIARGERAVVADPGSYIRIDLLTAPQSPASM